MCVLVCLYVCTRGRRHLENTFYKIPLQKNLPMDVKDLGVIQLDHRHLPLKTSITSGDINLLVLRNAGQHKTHGEFTLRHFQNKRAKPKKHMVGPA